MEVHLDAETRPIDAETRPMEPNKPKQKPRRPAGRVASSPAVVAEQTGRLLAEREHDWLKRLTADPASFARIEIEVHEQARQQADLYVAGLLAKASEQPEMGRHIEKVIAEAEVPLRLVEKKDGRWWSAFWVAWRSR
jgi:hypothetical protein